MIKLKGTLTFFAILSFLLACVVNLLLVDFLQPQRPKGFNEVVEDVFGRDLPIIQSGNVSEKRLLEIVEKVEKRKSITILIADQSGKVLSEHSVVQHVNPAVLIDGYDGRIENESIFTVGLADERFILLLTRTKSLSSDFNFWYVFGSFILIFLFLLWGRITYIGEMSATIKRVASGSFRERLPIKYRDELTELARSINHMASELQDHEEKQKELITNISHDIRTPLTSIIGYFKMIKEKRYTDEEEFVKYIDIIDRKVHYLKNVTEGFFDYSKLASGDYETNYHQLYVQELVRQLVEEEQSHFVEKQLELKATYDPEPAYILSDGELLSRALGNLLSNAYKYSKPGSKVKVSVATKRVNRMDYVCISCVNTPNDPLKKAELGKIFERTYKRETARNIDGSGLGLAIVQEICKQLEGAIHAKLDGDDLIMTIMFKKIPDALK